MNAPIEANTQSRGDIFWFDLLDEAKCPLFRNEVVNRGATFFDWL